MKTTSIANPVIAKMAQLMMAIETRIENEGRVYLPKQRSRFIDITTLGLSPLEDGFFTYDHIKNIVIIMVQRHESGAEKWAIDTEQCTADHVAVVIGEGRRGKLTRIPSGLFLATGMGHTNPIPTH
ncbi:hypothetical protein V3O24_04505 [Methylobacter sp. Wu8]|uniref:hypothetical protein n=1 Tax=Methylobacter sp. Wu8 TaxID=3118457 RepID=UPI002F2DBE17